MSEKKRRKKDGEDKNRNAQAMRDDVQERKEGAHRAAHKTDRPDVVIYKSGAPEDRTRRGAR